MDPEEKKKFLKLAKKLKEKGYSEEQIKKVLKKKLEKEKKKEKRKKKKDKSKVGKWIVIIVAVIAIVIGVKYFDQIATIMDFSDLTYNTSTVLPSDLYISNKYYYVPAEEMLKDKNRKEPYGIKLRYYHMSKGIPNDLSSYVKEFPMAYRYDFNKQKYKISLIRVYNNYLTDVKVYYRMENESEYKVVDAEFKPISYPAMQTTGNILIKDLLLDEGRYCFYVEGKDVMGKKMRSKEFCKNIVPFSFEEDKLSIRIIKPYVLIFEHLAFYQMYNFYQRMIEEINLKNINFKFVDLSNPKLVKIINSSQFIKLLNDTQEIIRENRLFDLISDFGIPLSELEGFNYNAIKVYAIINDNEYDITLNVFVEDVKDAYTGKMSKG